MARILNKPASIVEKGSTWQGCVDFFFYIYRVSQKMYLKNVIVAMVHRLNHQWLAPQGPGMCFLVVSY